MKLTNVHYEYRGNDTWRIYFKDYKECETFQNERTDGKKPMCSAIFTNGLGIRYYVEAKLQGMFYILRYRAKDPTNDYFSNDVWRALVKKIEGADSDYIFDEIDLWYVATVDKCYFRICCINGTWTEFFVKNMLNSQFGMVAQANGYYDTDTVGQGGLCTRRSCCGIGIDRCKDKYGNVDERIIFTVKNFCRGEADIIKVSCWTNTFIGTNKENEKEYSWNDFKEYVQKLSATGSDIWDIEYEYDETCPMTGTEVADKLHVYLKPLAYKRLFEKEEDEKKDKKVWISSNSSLWSNDDYLARVKALTPPPVPYWMKQDDDHVEPTKTLLANLHLRIDVAKVKPTKILVQGTATIIWWSDGTKTVVKCQKGDKMDPEKGIAMCVMKKFMGTNETHSNYLDFAKPAIEAYEKQQAAEKARKKAEADKRRRAAAKKKGTAGNANYKRGAKGKAETENKEES